MFLQQGFWYLSHKTYMTFLFSSFINRLCKPAYTRLLNSMNLKSLSRFSMVRGCSWMLDVTHGFSDKIIFHPAHLFLMCCVGGALNTWIFMDVQQAYMYHSDFHPCHQAMQITPSHLHAAPSYSLINDAEKMFFFSQGKLAPSRQNVWRYLMEVIILALFCLDDLRKYIFPTDSHAHTVRLKLLTLEGMKEKKITED